MKTFKSQQQSFSYFLFFSLNPTVSIGAKGLLELFTRNVHCVYWWVHMYMPQTRLQLSFIEELFSTKCQSFYYAIVKSGWKEMHGYCCSTKWYAVTSIVNRKPLKKLHGFYYIRTEDSKMDFTCGWWATLTLSNCKKVGSALFWKSLPLRTKIEH